MRTAFAPVLIAPVLWVTTSTAAVVGSCLAGVGGCAPLIPDAASPSAQTTRQTTRPLRPLRLPSPSARRRSVPPMKYSIAPRRASEVVGRFARRQRRINSA
jgi:hypothetical protein